MLFTCENCSVKFNENEKEVIEFDTKDYCVDCFVEKMFPKECVNNDYGIIQLWATADETGLYLDVFDKEEDAQKSLDKKEDLTAIRVIKGYGVIYKDGYMPDDATSFHNILDFAVQELEEFMKKDGLLSK